MSKPTECAVEVKNATESSTEGQHNKKEIPTKPKEDETQNFVEESAKTNIIQAQEVDKEHIEMENESVKESEAEKEQLQDIDMELETNKNALGQGTENELSLKNIETNAEQENKEMDLEPEEGKEQPTDIEMELVTKEKALEQTTGSISDKMSQENKEEKSSQIQQPKEHIESTTVEQANEFITQETQPGNSEVVGSKEFKLNQSIDCINKEDEVKTVILSKEKNGTQADKCIAEESLKDNQEMTLDSCTNKNEQSEIVMKSMETDKEVANVEPSRHVDEVIESMNEDEKALKPENSLNLEEEDSLKKELNKEAVEGIKNYVNLLSESLKDCTWEEQNESQESMNLIIDEKIDELEKIDASSDEEVNESPETLINSFVDNHTKASDDKNEAENIEKPHEVIEETAKISDEKTNPDKDCTIIEIDDEDEEEMKETGGFSAHINEQTLQDEKKTNDVAIAAPQAKEHEDVEMTNDDVCKDSSTRCLKEVSDENLLQATQSPPLTAQITERENIRSEYTDDEIFYGKECVNLECARSHKQFMRAPNFALSYFRVTKKKFKSQFICVVCYDKALDTYEEFSGTLMNKQPLLMHDIVAGRQEFVEIIDSSDEEDESNKNEKENEFSCFSKADLLMISNELEKSIKETFDKVQIQNQLTWSKTLLTERSKRLARESDLIDAELTALQRKADKMHVSLYQCPKIKIRQMLSLDLNSGMPYQSINKDLLTLPGIGEIQRPPVQLNGTYYAVKNKAIASWVPCKVIESVDGTMGGQKGLKHFKIKFVKSQYQMVKTVSVKHLAYFDPPNVRLPIGSRVIAYFDATLLSRGKEKMSIQSAFYPGIIAEPLKVNNRFRYLVFYDDGYTQYVYHKDVRLVCHVSENVWEDVHPGSRDFIQKYLTQYSINRPMVQTQKGQSMTTESNGKWIYARVIDIDCSLIQMQFESPKSHTEWIYRGSLRLGPVFKEYQKTQKDEIPISRLPRRTEPFIRYTEDEEAATITKQKRTNELKEQAAENAVRAAETRAVAKKSVSRQDSVSTQFTHTPPPAIRHLNNSTIYVEDENKPKGKVVYYTAKRNLLPRPFQPHNCTNSCLFEIHHNLNAYSPLSKPLLSGWERMFFRQKIKKSIIYRGPCGRILRNMKELHFYLRSTKNELNVENFDFCTEINCLAEYIIENMIIQKRDISCGQEKMAIPLVNYYDNTIPPACTYAAQRIPTEGVHLNLNEEFLVGCDCEDDCSDKSKCACWHLTYAGAKYGNPNTPIDEIGYQYKRLYEHVPTGIYECNSRCKCKSNCLNRVVQHSLEMKLQVFKTSNRGWGLRCINDVPRGSFICIYAGNLLTEAKANEGGLDAGDEYFAELDYIEVAEQIKEGYESDVDTFEPEEDEDFGAPEMEDDAEFRPSKSFLTRSKRQQRQMRGSNENDSQERQVINFNPNADMNEKSSLRESSMRSLFGTDEACYVMDAKTIGNLGRYFNHSCSPNLFVQNVFVDTHDLRFPWVAFFSSSNIRAGTELTWNYNYEVGVVPGKVLYCQCGASNCRLRLL